MLRRTGSLALLLALALTGCGDDSSSPDAGDGGDDPVEETSDRETATSSGDPAADGGCRFLGADAVTAAAGSEVELTTAGPATCFFGATDDASELRVVVNQVPLAIDAQTYAEGAREGCEGEVTDVEVADAVDAFACVAFTTQGFLFVDGDSVVVDVDGTPDDAAGVALAAALLPEITLD